MRTHKTAIASANSDLAIPAFVAGASPQPAHIFVVRTFRNLRPEALFECSHEGSIHMTFSYNGAPGTSTVDTIRFLVGDTVATEHFLEDEEIVFIDSQWENKGTPYYAAAMAADAIAAKVTREIDINSDGQTLSLSQLRERYLNLSETLRAQHEDALVGGSSLYAGGMDAHESPDTSVEPLAFGTGMHDHREAGRQDYGNVDNDDYAARMAQWGEQVP